MAASVSFTQTFLHLLVWYLFVCAVQVDSPCSTHVGAQAAQGTHKMMQQCNGSWWIYSLDRCRRSWVNCGLYGHMTPNSFPSSPYSLTLRYLEHTGGWRFTHKKETFSVSHNPKGERKVKVSCLKTSRKDGTNVELIRCKVKEREKIGLGSTVRSMCP